MAAVKAALRAASREVPTTAGVPCQLRDLCVVVDFVEVLPQPSPSPPMVWV